jgi:alpha-N-arabinofuranosidase
MYKVHQDAQEIPLDLSTPDYHSGRRVLPAISASASRDSQGRVHISLVNTDPDHAINLSGKITASAFSSVSGRVLTGAEMDAHNTFDHPDAIKPAVFDGALLKAGTLNVHLPAKSVVVLELR